MQTLIQIVENEPRVNHRVVAEHTENQQKNIAELIHKYRDEFDEFGVCPFKTEAVSEEKLKQNPDAKPTKTYYLNEPQATFLMTLLRNKPIVVKFKKRLVKEFYEMKSHKQTNLTQGDMSSVIVEMLKTQQSFMENQQRQTDALIDLTGAVIKLVENKTTVKQAHVLPFPTLKPKINTSERKDIREVINKRATTLSLETGMNKQSITPGIYVAFKNHFNLDEYGELEQFLYLEALSWLKTYEPRTKYTYPTSKDDVKIVIV